MNLTPASTTSSHSYANPWASQPDLGLLPPPHVMRAIPSSSATSSSALPGPDGASTSLFKRQRVSMPATGPAETASRPRESKHTDLLQQALKRDHQQASAYLQWRNSVDGEQRKLASMAPPRMQQLRNLVQPHHQQALLEGVPGLGQTRSQVSPSS